MFTALEVSEVAQLCPTLCDPMDCSLPGSSVHRIFQARILEWVAISFSRRSSRPRDQTQVSHIVGRHFTVWATREVHCIGRWILNPWTTKEVPFIFIYFLAAPDGLWDLGPWQWKCQVLTTGRPGDFQFLKALLRYNWHTANCTDLEYNFIHFDLCIHTWNSWPHFRKWTYSSALIKVSLSYFSILLSRLLIPEQPPISFLWL